MIKKSVSLWLPRFEAVDQGVITEEDSDPVEVVYMLLFYFHAVSQCKLVIYSEEIYSYIMKLISFICFVVCTKISNTPFLIPFIGYYIEA